MHRTPWEKKIQFVFAFFIVIICVFLKWSFIQHLTKMFSLSFTWYLASAWPLQLLLIWTGRCLNKYNFSTKEKMANELVWVLGTVTVRRKEEKTLSNLKACSGGTIDILSKMNKRYAKSWQLKTMLSDIACFSHESLS